MPFPRKPISHNKSHAITHPRGKTGLISHLKSQAITHWKWRRKKEKKGKKQRDSNLGLGWEKSSGKPRCLYRAKLRPLAR